MSTFFGIFSPSGLVAKPAFEEMRETAENRGCKGIRVHEAAYGKLSIGHFPLQSNAIDLTKEQQIVQNTAGSLVLAGHFRLDYKAELASKLGIADNPPADSVLALLAYEKWGADCVHHLLGDWAFMVYDATNNSLFLAKDPLAGYSAIYYRQFGHCFYFSSDFSFLTAISTLPKNINVNELALFSFKLIDLTNNDTLLDGFYHIKPAHTITINAQLAILNSAYWDIRNTAAIRYKREEEYVEHFKELFANAVASHTLGSNKTGIFLSSGLDSSIVASYAAEFLQQKNESLYSFTSIPAFLDEIPVAEHYRVNEQPLVEELAAGIPNLHTSFENCMDVDVRRLFTDDFSDDPGNCKVAGNHLWIQAIFEKARAQGINRMLNGQCGNVSVSWHAPYLDTGMLLKEQFKSFMNRTRPLSRNPVVAAGILKEGVLNSLDWKQFAKEIIFLPRYTPVHSSFQQRYLLLMHSAAQPAMNWYAMSQRYGVEIADPTADTKLASFSFGIPETLWHKNGTPKFLYIEAFREKLPGNIIQSKVTKVQGADLGTRLEKQTGFLRLLDEIVASADCSEWIDREKLKQHISLFKEEKDWQLKKRAANNLLLNISTFFCTRKLLYLQHKTFSQC